MSWEWEQYRDRYAANRPGTFEAYVTVWQVSSTARSEFGGWASFSQCANAEPAKQTNESARVAEAEAIMRENGFEIGPYTKRGARTWRPSKNS